MNKFTLMLVFLLIFSVCGKDDTLKDTPKEKNTVYGVISSNNLNK